MNVIIIVLVSSIDFHGYIVLFHTVVGYWLMIVFDFFGDFGYVNLECLRRLYVIGMPLDRSLESI